VEVQRYVDPGLVNLPPGTLQVSTTGTSATIYGWRITNSALIAHIVSSYLTNLASAADPNWNPSGYYAFVLEAEAGVLGSTNGYWTSNDEVRIEVSRGIIRIATYSGSGGPEAVLWYGDGFGLESYLLSEATWRRGQILSCTTASDCQDQNACTADTCENSVCVNNPVCVTAAGCDDQNNCTVDSCQTACCVHTPLCLSAADCNDNNACTNDACAQGCCQNAPVPCDDNDPCTQDTCDPQSGCTHTPINPTAPECMPAQCGDGIVQPGEQCDGTSAGQCVSGNCRSDCTCEPPSGTEIPTVSGWGIVTLALALLVLGKVGFNRVRNTG